MKQVSKIAAQVILGGLTALVATSVLAQNDPRKDGTFFGYEARGKWMVGVKGAIVQNSEADFGDATNVGLLFGYTFARPVGINGSASIEFEGTSNTDEGDIGPDSNFGPNVTGQWDVDTLALFFAYRTPGVVYFKGKLGGVQSKVEARLSNGTTASQDDFGFAYGAGLGVRLGNHGKIEAEYTGVSGDNDIGLISLGGILEF